jgi:hypothetical protein
MVPVAAVPPPALALMAGVSQIQGAETVNSDGAADTADPVAAFRQLVAQIVAESESAESGNAPSPQTPAGASSTPTEKPSGLASLNSNQPNLTPANSNSDPASVTILSLPRPTANVAPPATVQAVLPPMTYADRRRTDSTAKDRSGNDDKKPPAVAVAVPFVVPFLPVPVTIAPPVMPHVERFDAGAADDARYGLAQPAPERPAQHSPETIVLQPPPVLQVRIHSQPAEAAGVPAPAPATSAPLAVPVPPAVPKPAAQAPPALPVIEVASKERDGAQPESGSRQSSEDGTRDNRQPPAIQPEHQTTPDTTPRAAIIPEASTAIPHPKVESGPATPAPSPQPVSTSAIAPAHVTLPAPVPEARPEAKPEPAAAASPSIPEPPPEATKAATPMRSLALEFTPDGAHDIKVRLSEHAGDVHISLHGTDPALAGRVREGVSDLVGSLAKAGYDAEAWTPGQGGQGQRQQPGSGKRARARSEAGEEFSEMLPQPIEETL